MLLLLVSACGQTKPPSNRGPTEALRNSTSQWHGTYDPQNFGASCDGSTNDSTALNSAISAIVRNGGGVLELPAGRTCVANVSLRSGVMIQGGHGVSTSYDNSEASTLKDGSGGTRAVVEISEGAHNAGITRVRLVGNGSGGADRGLYIARGNRIYAEHVSCYSFGEECVRWEGGVSLYLRDIYAVNSLLNRSRSQYSGVVYMGGTDGYLFDSEITASTGTIPRTITSRRLYVDAIVLKGANNWVVNTVGELSDMGIECEGSQQRIVNSRFDLNYGHGAWVNCGGQWIGNLALRNGQAADNTYDGFHVVAGNNIFTGNVADSSSKSNRHRYGFFDSTEGDTVFNTWSDNYSIAAGTSTYSMAESSPSAVRVTNKEITVANGTTTPSVDNISVLTFAQSTPVTITKFLHGSPGQTILLLGNANVAITNDDMAIFTASGTNEKLENNKIYRFTFIKGAWYEDASRK